MAKTKKSTNYWSSIIANYESSGLSKSEFCKVHKVDVSRFYYWCSKLRPDLNSPLHVKQPVTEESSEFISLKTASQGADNSLTITLSSGLKLQFDTLPAPNWIAGLISSVGNSHAQS